MYIGLGSNLPMQGIGSPVEILQQALHCIAAMPDAELTDWSSTYESEPLPGSGTPQSRYANAVCSISTTLTPEALLLALQGIEQTFGRVRSGHRWAARTLDLDLLLFDARQLDTPELTIPHYAMLERNFVLIPLLEIQPDLHFVDGRAIAELPAAQDRSGLALIKRFTCKELALV
ncbi:2-amino-4-hydroxy-6-hydroxymethyldihydropteridine diphosphokinase [Allohahella marinimesophila]|uniref:2-amino-4-hydroxy-6- hydroxymethyldihydropteridine diphosphokinase n=1 Tax=Allohahella marinimesophila TaxID=1054972 RepID=UPI0031DADE79